MPLTARAILTGFFVSSVGIAVWSAALVAVPAPWSIFPMIGALWLFCRFFSGRLRPKRSADTRKEYFRSVKLQPSVWHWGLGAAIIFVIIVQASFVVTFRLVEFPATRFTADYKALDRLPLWAAWAIIIMSSIVAGICEETGFRGYMQVPLEKRYGPVTAIIITSVIFMLIHLSHAWAAPILPHIFFASVLLGILAYKSGSLLPGIIGHSILDVFDYSVWWTDLTGGFKKQTIFKTALDVHFIVWLLIFAFAFLGFLITINRLNRKAKH